MPNLAPARPIIDERRTVPFALSTSPLIVQTALWPDGNTASILISHVEIAAIPRELGEDDHTFASRVRGLVDLLDRACERIGQVTC